MDSLSATEIERKRALSCIGRVCAFRVQNRPEEEVASLAGFQSVGEMARQLEKWGLPEWIVRDSAPPKPEQLSEGKEQKPRRARKAKKFGPKVPLPPAERAIPLFKGRVHLLMKSMDSLRGLQEYLQSERFVGESEKDGKRRVWGAQQAPPEPLTTLIAIEALVSESVTTSGMERLLDALHPSESVEERKPYRGGTLTARKPDPKKVNLEQLQEQMRRLRESAENVARLVRGVESIRRGRRTDPISTRLHAAYDLVKQRTEEGYSEEEILKEANTRLDRDPFLEATEPGAEDLTLDDIRYLKSLDF